MQIKNIVCKFLSLSAKSWTFEEREGISYKLRVSIEGEGYDLKCSKEQYDVLVSKGYKKQDDLEVDSILVLSGGRLSLNLVEVL